MTKIVKNLLLSHFYLDVFLFIFSTCSLMIQWASLSLDHKLAYGLLIGMCIHQLEEYRFPGGFVWGFNKFMFNSDMPNKYPGNRLSSAFIDISAMLLAAPFLYWHYSITTGICFAIFALIEVLGHFMFGIKAFNALKNKGKETIYFPGSLTSWIFFAPLSITFFYFIMHDHLVFNFNWIHAVLILIAYFVIGFFWPFLGWRDKNTKYPYDEQPLAGFYFKKFY